MPSSAAIVLLGCVPLLLAVLVVSVMARRLRVQALRDPLTGLPNRALLDEHLTAALARARRGRRAVAVASIDLDDFKLVNDGLGHAAGDDLLRAVARRMASCIRDTDVLARQGGDEFLLLLADLEDGATARAAGCAALERIRAAVGRPFDFDGAELQIGLSMGIAVHPDDATEADELLRHADAAMYRAKQAGGGMAFHEERAGSPIARLSLGARLRRAIDGGELELHFQPIEDLTARAIVGVESLVRWRHPERGLVPPGEFVPAAEQTGVIDALSDWVVEETSRQARAWAALGLLPRFGVNVSPRQLRRPDLAERITDRLDAAGVARERVVIELTESAWMLEAGRTRPAVEALRDAGLTLALDDFGAGYSSLSRLIDLPVDVLKVDRAFLAGVPERAQAVAVLAAILQLADSAGCDVVLEGIETAPQLDLVTAMGFRLGQGFGLARPAAAEVVTPLLVERLAPSRRAAAGPALVPAHVD